MGDYIKLDRKILEWEWWNNINVSRLFIYMLLKANWKDGKFEGEEIKRGSFVSSYPKLELETGLSISEIRTAVNKLKRTDEITVKSQTKYSVFTVKNYELYQGVDRQIDRQIAGESQTNRRQIATIEEVKKERINNIYNACELFEDFWLAYPKKSSKVLAEQEYASLFITTELQESDLVTASKNYAEACSILKKAEQFIKNPANWLKENIWMDYMPDKYKKPEVKEKEKKSTNKFTSYASQRTYDYAALEKQLLGIKEE